MNPWYYINIIYNKTFDLQNMLILSSQNMPLGVNPDIMFIFP